MSKKIYVTFLKSICFIGEIWQRLKAHTAFLDSLTEQHGRMKIASSGWDEALKIDALASSFKEPPDRELLGA